MLKLVTAKLNFLFQAGMSSCQKSSILLCYSHPVVIPVKLSCGRKDNFYLFKVLTLPGQDRVDQSRGQSCQVTDLIDKNHSSKEKSKVSSSTEGHKEDRQKEKSKLRALGRNNKLETHLLKPWSNCFSTIIIIKRHVVLVFYWFSFPPH